MTTSTAFCHLVLALVLAILVACGGGGNTPAGTSRSWQPPLLIEQNDLGDGSFPEVAMDPGGNAMAVWSQYDGTEISAYASRYTVSGGWSAPEIIETSNDTVVLPHVAMDANGNAMAVWTAGTDGRVYGNYYTVGAGWGTAQPIQTDNGTSVIPRVAMDPAGNAIAVWMQHDGSQYLIRARRFQPGTGWAAGPAALVDANNPGDAGFPQVVMDASGNAFAVWYEEGGAITDVWANRFTPASGWGTPVPIENNSAGSAEYPKIAVGPTGNAIATWHQHDGTRNNIWINRYEPGAGWLGAIEIDNTNENTHQPEIAFDGRGEAMVVWQQIDGATFKIFASRYLLSHDWTTPQQVSGGNPLAHELNPVVALDGAGNGIVAWTENDTPSSIVANRFDAASGWKIPAPLENDDTNSVGIPRVAMNAAGQGVAVWHQTDGLRNNIWAALFQ